MEYSILWFLVLGPMVLGVASLLAPKALQRAYAIVGAATSFVLTLLITKSILFTKQSSAAIEQTLSWLPDLGANLVLRLDSVSAWFVFVNAVVFLLVTSLNGVWYRKHAKLYTFLALVWIGLLNGAFLSVNLIFFYLFFEAALIPALFVVGIWGSGAKASATFKFLLMSIAGSILMLVSIFYLVSVHHEVTGKYSANIADLSIIAHMGPKLEMWLCFIGFLVAFLIKLPMVPFHGWLKDVYVSSPMPGTIMMSSVMSKLAAFGFISIMLPLFSEALVEHQGVLMGLASGSVLYAAFLAYKTDDAKTALAYSSISHLGFLALAFFALNQDSVKAVMLLVVGHSLGSALMFGFLHKIEESVGADVEINLRQHYGLAKRMPALMVLGFVSLLMAVALPGTLNFTGEFVSLWSAFKVSRLSGALAGLGVIFGAAYMFKFYQSLAFGKVTEVNIKANGLSIEIMAMVLIVLMALYFGVQPIWIMKG